MKPRRFDRGYGSRTVPVLASAIVLVAAVSAAAGAVVEARTGQFTGCLSNGKLTEVALGGAPHQACKKGEVVVTWNRDAAATRWYEDHDGDGYGDFYAFLDSPVQPPGFVANNLDCNDDAAAVNPAHGPDDGTHGWADADCDGSAGEDVLLRWYRDGDGDGFGLGGGAASVRPRSEGALEGHVLNGADCDDDDAAATPYTSHCQPGVDPGRLDTDLDDDGFEGIVVGGPDCDDFDPERFAGNAEWPDPFGHDEDCDRFTGDVVPYDAGWLDPRIPPQGTASQSELQQARS